MGGRGPSQLEGKTDDLQSGIGKVRHRVADCFKGRSTMDEASVQAVSIGAIGGGGDGGNKGSICRHNGSLITGFLGHNTG